MGVDTAQLALERAVSCVYVPQKTALLIDRLHHQIDNRRRIATSIGKEDVGLGSAMKVGGRLGKQEATDVKAQMYRSGIVDDVKVVKTSVFGDD